MDGRPSNRKRPRSRLTQSIPSRSPRRGAGGGASRKPKGADPRTAKRIKGRTIYLSDNLFERILVQSYRRNRTSSDYVVSILERQVPDHRIAWGTDPSADVA